MTALQRAVDAAERVGTLEGAVRGGAALPIVAPDTEDAFVDLVHRCGADRLRVLPIGIGSKLGWTNLARSADLAVSTRRLVGVTHHEPDDGTISALAGTTMTELATRARAGGHHLSPEVPYPDHATLGGVVAAGASGVDRLRFGPLRNQLLGTRTLLADGTVTKSGGRLVKNVTGFDLHRLFCGSHGSLGIVLEASLRLHPAPEVVEHLVLDCRDLDDATQVARDLRALPIAPWVVAIDAEAPSAPAHVHLELAGRAEAVEHERGMLGARWSRAVPHAGGVVADERRHYAGGEGDPRRGAVARLAVRPSRWERLWRDVAPLHGPRSPLRFVRIRPQLATLELQLDACAGPAVTRLVEDLRTASRSTGARVSFGGPARLREGVDCFDGDPTGLFWMRALRERFDPHGLFAGGRGAGGL